MLRQVKGRHYSRLSELFVFICRRFPFQTAFDGRQLQGEYDQYGGNQVQVGGAHAYALQLFVAECEGNHQAIDDRAEDGGQGDEEDAFCRQQVFADDDGGQADDDGADAAAHVGAAAGLGEQCAAQGDEGVGEGHAEDDHFRGGHALGARHAGVNAGGAYGQTGFGVEEPVEQEFCGDDEHQDDERLNPELVGKIGCGKGGEDAGRVDKGQVGRAAGNAQVERIEGDHDQDAGQKGQDVQ